MIHGSEMFRHGYFGDSVITLENPYFLILCDLIFSTNWVINGCTLQ